jgi:hypothetical protein
MKSADAPSRPSARVTALIARQAPKAVVFRRGPSRTVCVLNWDLETDTLTPGQWFRGRIYDRRCDLSPDGKLLVYFAGYRGEYRSWTAISRPPYLTALALWPKGDGWGGGGLFQNERTLELNHRPAGDEWARDGDETHLAPDFRLPDGFRVRPFGERPGWGEDDPIYSARLERDGWRPTDEGGAPQENRDGPVWITFDPPFVRAKPLRRDGLELRLALHGIKERDGRWYLETGQIVAPGDHILADLGRVDWADVDHNGDVLVSQGGRLFRMRIPPHATAVLSAPALVADLNDMRFERRSTPPEARTWPTATP